MAWRGAICGAVITGLARPAFLMLEAADPLRWTGAVLNKLQAYARRARIADTNPELDHAEMDWWNTNAPLIERIWGLPDSLCSGVRQTYIRGVGKRFHQLLGARRLRILEIACGSGWPGRLLASPDLMVVGVDFSESQIALAREKASETGQQNCEYVQMDINSMNDTFRSGEYDGAFIHCGIHHLAKNELEGFAAGLALTPKGFPTILVEPVYLDRATFLGRLWDKALRAVYVLTRNLYMGRVHDAAVMHDQDRLASQATDNNWWLSPKEAPFDVPELHRLFGKDFEIREITPVTRYALEAGQHLATLKDQARAARVGRRVLPFFRWLDALLSELGLLPLQTRDYQFSRIVLIRK
jgi:SAM-dependent methyltransferase